MAGFLPTAATYATGVGIPAAIGAPAMGGIGLLTGQPGMAETGAILGGTVGASMMASDGLKQTFNASHRGMGEAFENNVFRRHPYLPYYALLGSAAGAAGGLGYNLLTRGNDINVAIPTAALGTIAPATVALLHRLLVR